MDTVEEILAWFGGVSAVVLLSVGATVSAFKYFGEKWIEQKLQKDLQRHRHAQSVEIQRLRLEIETLLNGSRLIQQKEFDEIQQCWIKMLEAEGAVGGLVNILQTYPDLNRYDDESLEEFLSGSELLETQKRDIRHSSDKTKAYSEEIYWHHLSDAKNKLSKFNTQRLTNAIIFEPAINSLLEQANQLLRECINKHEIGNEVKDWKTKREAYQHFIDEFYPVRGQLQSLFQNQIRRHSFFSSTEENE